MTSEIRNVANFLGIELTDAEAVSIEEKCSFDYMRQSSSGTALQDVFKLFRKGEWAYGDHETLNGIKWLAERAVQN